MYVLDDSWDIQHTVIFDEFDIEGINIDVYIYLLLDLVKRINV